ncbi:DUF2306 domain-containing protein [Emticicia sp. CRIBPO]|uniref:DUF2306 domain-containing protein n=1 Tax=Emticicia sp. CRIBPO TaxID=2683258 RepID=UPI0014135665|nr:DUF2306 domain-containing protein [Emticicia sp. CRIBPO]NBA88362.1 DUF2306 domain-containing protein [Emticicia sp. CRIBPO]
MTEIPLSSSTPVSQKIFRIATILLTATVWVSALLFGLYILAFYAAALYEGHMDRWNEILPRLYEQKTKAATTGIGLHFAAGGIILILGSIQLMDGIRERFLTFHRWTGRIYVLACLLAAVGGLIFIAVKGTIGGTVMDIGFGLYGVLMFIAAIETYRHAVAGRLEKHRAWGLRLFALAIGSWLYRMDYGFWLLFKGGGHTSEFNGAFDMVMAFFFYLPNLLVVEIFLRARSYNAKPVAKIAASVVLFLATGFLLTGTYFFTKYYWGPAITGWLFG